MPADDGTSDGNTIVLAYNLLEFSIETVEYPPVFDLMYKLVACTVLTKRSNMQHGSSTPFHSDLVKSQSKIQFVTR